MILIVSGWISVRKWARKQSYQLLGFQCCGYLSLFLRMELFKYGKHELVLIQTDLLCKQIFLSSLVLKPFWLFLISQKNIMSLMLFYCRSHSFQHHLIHIYAHQDTCNGITFIICTYDKVVTVQEKYVHGKQLLAVFYSRNGSFSALVFMITVSSFSKGIFNAYYILQQLSRLTSLASYLSKGARLFTPYRESKL